MEVETDPDRPLFGAIDVDALFGDEADRFFLKGMFFRSVAKTLGPKLDRVLDELEERPGPAGWLPFRDYPQRDYTVLSLAAARLCYPHLSDREAIRRLARSDMEVFGNSMMGRVTLSLVGDTHRALIELPTIYQKIASGPWGFEATSEGPRALRYTFRNHPGEWSYQVGQCEGIAAHYGDRLCTRVIPDGRAVTMYLRW